MEQRILTWTDIGKFRDYLMEDEKSKATVEKYFRDARAFLAYAGENPVTKALVIQYKEHLIEKSYAVRSVNSMLASINSLLGFLGWEDCRVKALKMQREIYCAEEKELTREEYMRLLEAAAGRPRLHLILQAICGTGIRVSELKYFTVEAVRKGRSRFPAKGRTGRFCCRACCAGGCWPMRKRKGSLPA
ncbi:MAG: site-specific integrase [Lachnospiraceae bacterium]